MKRLILLVVIGLFGFVGSTSAQRVVETSSAMKNGDRVLQQSIVVDAPASAVWELLSTADGLRKFVAPNVEFELRSGGRWATSSDLNAKLDDTAVHNRVLSFVPGKMLSIQIGFPAGTPAEVRASSSLFAVTTLEPINAKRTRVIETMSGFGKSPSWDATYSMFKECNQETLEALRIAAETHRSIDWKGINPYSNHHHGGAPEGNIRK